jgi:WhiB family transcriptional regulator, redox-sensing transcriptional regulator
MTVRVNWREIAACRDADPDLFFPVGTAGPALRQIEEAKRICRACPAQARCLAWALDHGVASGVWGGTTQDERRAIRRSAEKSRPSARTTTMPRPCRDLDDAARRDFPPGGALRVAFRCPGLVPAGIVRRHAGDHDRGKG